MEYMVYYRRDGAPDWEAEFGFATKREAQAFARKCERQGMEAEVEKEWECMSETERQAAVFRHAERERECGLDRELQRYRDAEEWREELAEAARRREAMGGSCAHLGND